MFKRVFNKAMEFYKKHQEVVDYLFFGGLTTVVSTSSHFIALSFLTNNTSLNDKAYNTIATVFSWILAATFAFIVNKIFVFKNKERRKSDWFKQATAFYGARMVTLFMEIGLILLFVAILNSVNASHVKENNYIAKVLTQVFIVLSNYFISKFFVFKKKNKQ